MLSGAILSFCKNTTFKQDDEDSECDELTVLTGHKCFPVMYNNFGKFYEEQFVGEMFDVLKKTRGYFIHIWNKMLEFSKKSFQKGPAAKSAYFELAKIYCPLVVGTKVDFYSG